MDSNTIETTELNTAMGNTKDTMTNNLADKSFLEKHFQKMIAVAFWVIIIGTFFGYMRTQGLSLSDAFDQTLNFMKTSPWAPLIYILIYTLRPLVLFSALVLTLAGGFLFGPIWGIVLVVIGSNAGASLAYFMGKVLGGNFFGDESSEQGVIQNYASRMRNNSFETILTMRFIFLPYDLVNYLAGFLKVDFKAFLFATIVGSIPGTLAFTLAGASIEELSLTSRPDINPWVLVASVVIFVVSIILSRMFKRREGITS